MLTPTNLGFEATPITKGDNWLVDDNFLVVDEVLINVSETRLNTHYLDRNASSYTSPALMIHL